MKKIIKKIRFYLIVKKIRKLIKEYKYVYYNDDLSLFIKIAKDLKIDNIKINFLVEKYINFKKNDTSNIEFLDIEVVLSNYVIFNK